VAAAAAKRRDPYVDVPARSLSNVRYSKTRRIIEMGRNTNRRQLFKQRFPDYPAHVFQFI
jgi:DNA topoisomerase-6 subunit A